VLEIAVNSAIIHYNEGADLDTNLGKDCVVGILETEAHLQHDKLQFVNVLN